MFCLGLGAIPDQIKDERSDEPWTSDEGMGYFFCLVLFMFMAFHSGAG
jgi:hypothetical protein